MMDLNIHSSFSTGIKPVEEIINTSKSRNIDAISITDIFSTDSIGDIKEKGLQEEMLVIPGIEIPSREHLTGYGTDLTILGYGIPDDSKRLTELLDFVNHNRNARMADYYKSLQSKYTYLEDKDITIVDNHKYIDIKRLILESLKGLITEKQHQEIEKDMILNEFYTSRPNVETVIRIIKEAGGSPVLRYPSNIDVHSITLRLIIYHLKEYGLEGLLIRNDEIPYYEEIANRYGLERMTFNKIVSDEFKEKLLSKRIK